MSTALVLPRARGAHRKPFPLAAVAIYGTFTLATAAIAAFGLWAMLDPRPACHAVPMHIGWPNSRCPHAWAKWRQP